MNVAGNSCQMYPARRDTPIMPRCELTGAGNNCSQAQRTTELPWAKPLRINTSILRSRRFLAPLRARPFGPGAEYNGKWSKYASLKYSSANSLTPVTGRNLSPRRLISSIAGRGTFHARVICRTVPVDLFCEFFRCHRDPAGTALIPTGQMKNIAST